LKIENGQGERQMGNANIRFQIADFKLASPVDPEIDEGEMGIWNSRLRNGEWFRV
jgi:hypothetical protein